MSLMRASSEPQITGLALGISGMKITAETQAARHSTYTALRSHQYSLSWVPEWIDAALRRPGMTIPELQADESFFQECAEILRKYYPSFAPLTPTTLWEAPLNSKGAFLRSYIDREIARFRRNFKTDMSMDCVEECAAILTAQYVKQEPGYEVAGDSSGTLVAWYYYKFSWSQIRKVWPEMRQVAFLPKNEISIDAPTPDGLERQILLAPEAALHDENSEARSGVIKQSILTALASDPHTIALCRVLVKGECLSEVARDFHHEISWFANTVFPGFKRGLQRSLKKAGIAVAVKGRADARVMRRLYADMMQPSPSLPLGGNTRGLHEGESFSGSYELGSQ
jgi:hypothetical protein